VTPARRGRPRDAGLDEAIMASGWKLLSEAGYEGVTFDAVADLAGCSRPAIYRRFHDKRELVMAIVEAVARAYEEGRDFGEEPRQELIGRLIAFVGYLQSGGAGAIVALSQARRADPGLGGLLEALFARERTVYAEALRRARGEPRVSDEILLQVEAMLGAVLFRAALRSQPMAAEEVMALVDMTISGARDHRLAGAP